MLPARTYGISIRRDWRAVYEAIWRPEFFPEWAGGLSDSVLRKDGDEWVADSGQDLVQIRFSPHNDYGIMDHWVSTADGNIVHVPLRLVQNGDGAEVMLTLFRQPDMDDARFAADAKLIMRDLRALKVRIER